MSLDKPKVSGSGYASVVDATVSARCDSCGASIAVDDPTAVWEQGVQHVVANALGGIDFLRGEGPPQPRSTHVVKGPVHVWCGECAKVGQR